MEAYPLTWPDNYPRARYTTKSKFKVISFAVARDMLFAELKRLGAQKVILSTNIPLRGDGIPYASYKIPRDLGVAVYFQYKGKAMCFACDHFNKIEDNMWAIFKTIEAIRGIERWGSSQMLDRAFTGFAALPPAQSTQKEWWEVLGVQKTATFDQIKSARNSLAREYHPDSGIHPDASRMAQVNAAFEKAEKYFGR